MEATREAVRTGRIPSAMLLAADKSGKLSIAEAMGTRNAAGEPMTLDSVMRMASCTKLITAISVVQAHERGLLQLDTDVSQLVPELRELKTVREGKDGGFELEDVQGGLTLTQLLTHSAGFSYDFSDPVIGRWCTAHNFPPNRTGASVAESFHYPLSFKPGTAWNYGPNIDWAGRVLEAVTGTSLDAWVQEHIATPLGVADSMTFFLQRRAEMKTRVATTAVRDASGKAYHPEELPRWAVIDTDDAMGGGGGRFTAAAYFAVLRSLLLDDGKLLSSKGRELLFKPALSPAAEKSINQVGHSPNAVRPHGLATPAVHKSYALGGLAVLEDAAGPIDGKAWRRKGSLSWSGMPNHFWNVDPEAGVCMLICFHLDPWADPTCIELATRFEEEVYAMAS